MKVLNFALIYCFLLFGSLVECLTQGSWSTNNRTVIGLTDARIHAIVDEALAKYDADKTGLVDYALESSGKTITIHFTNISFLGISHSGKNVTTQRNLHFQ